MNMDKKGPPKVFLGQKIALIIPGVLLTIAILEISLRVGGLIFVSAQEFRNRLSMRQKNTYRIMCVGESTTAIFRVPVPYPSLLEEILNNAKAGISFSVINRGVVATGTSDILFHLKGNLDLYKPNMVIAMMGINDCGYLSYKVTPSFSPEFFLGRFRTYNLFKLIWLRSINKLKEIKQGKGGRVGSQGRGFLSSESREHSAGKNRIGESDIGRKVKFDAGRKDNFAQRGLYYKEQGRFALAEDLFNKAIAVNVKDSGAYRNLGWLFLDQGKYAKAEEKFTEAIRLNPDEPQGYFGLALASREQNESKYFQAEEAFKRAIELDPNNGSFYFMSGYFYRDQMKNHFLAAEAFKKAILLLPENYMAYRELGKTYILQGKYRQAEELFEEFRHRYPRNDRIYQDLIQLYEGEGHSNKAAELGKECFWRVTAKNYIKMKEILDEKKIKLVCVQYPMRNIAPLKEIFAAKSGIIFVDNEKIFKEAVNNGNYNEYFMEKMFYDFGHCTEKGNRLLAENIARTILKELLGG